jgi:hypothetical protein
VKFKQHFSFSGTLILTILGICLAAPIISPYDPYAIAVGDPFAGPSAAHWFGTDDLGRDLLSRVLYGGRITILISMSATVIALIIGTLWGVTAGVRHGWVDEFLMRTTDTFCAGLYFCGWRKRGFTSTGGWYIAFAYDCQNGSKRGCSGISLRLRSGGHCKWIETLSTHTFRNSSQYRTAAFSTVEYQCGSRGHA